MRRRGHRQRHFGIEWLEPRQLLAAQIYDGQLNGKIVYTSPGHGWQWNTTLGRYATDRGDNNEIVEDFGNQDQVSFYADYILRAGGTVVPMRPIGHQTREIVLDNDSAGVTFTGAWSNSASAQHYDEDYGSSPDAVGYRFASTTSGAETSVATYQPTFGVAGFYPVYTWVLSSANRTTQLYRVNHTGGSTELRVDHRMVGKGWVYLGTYYFNAGSNANGNVQISNNSSVAGNVIADAIRFGNGMGDFVDSGAPGISGYSREDENAYKWLRRSLGQGVTASSIIGTGNVSAPSLMAEWMNSDTNPFGSSVYIGFHSNAGGGRGAVGLIDADAGDRTPHQADLATYLGRQINQDMQALNGTFEYNWSTRTTHTFTGQFGEIDLGGNAEMDATIIEVAFHDSVEDAAIMRDPKGRDQIARSVYEGTLEYFRNWGGLGVPVSAPLAPTAVRAIANAAGNVTITWTAPATRANGPAAATAYRVYSSRDGYGFSDPVVVSGATSLTIPAAQLDGNAYYFKVAAINAGGEGPGSVVVGARKNGAGGGGGTNRILIVNGFDRFERSQNERYGYAFVGDGLVDRVRRRHNNTFDYVNRFGEAIEAYNANGASLGFDTVQNEQVANDTVNLSNYQTVIWISGNESTDDETFSAAEQTRLTNYLNLTGKRLFVSGAEIGWDLDGPTSPTAADVLFYNQRLRADYVNDDAGTYTASGAAGSIFNGLSITFDNGANSNDDNIYNVAFPDVIAASNGSTIAMTYTGGTGGGAAVQWADAAAPNARGVNMGFPFETITTVANRNGVMAAILGYFETAVAGVSATPTSVDLLAADDTGSSSSDNLTNRDNSSPAKTLRFVVAGTVAGATVTVYDGTTLIGTATGVAGSTTVTTNGTTDLADGPHAITAKQTETGKTISAASPSLGIVIDTAAPTADVVDVSPDPRLTGVTSIAINFNEVVSGFDVGDLSLTRNAGGNLLTGSNAPTTGNNVHFTVPNLSSITSISGSYLLTLNASGSGVVDAAGNVFAANSSDAWTHSLPAWLSSTFAAASWNSSTQVLTLTGVATIIADPGSDNPAVSADGAGASLTINPASGLAVHFAALSLTNGATATLNSVGAGRTASNHRVLVLSTPNITIDANSKLDLADNDLIVDYDTASPIDAVEDLIRHGRNGGNWLGQGITSSTAAANASVHTLGVIDNATPGITPFATFSGQTVDTTTVLIKFTHRSDLNLDGVVTFGDSVRFNNNYAESNPVRWVFGDLNFNGISDFSDSVLFNGGYDESLGAM